jgi:2,4'-dihydroxyacetophenone dioxygenase
MSFESTDLLINVDDLSWKPMSPGGWGKVIRTCPETGTWTALLKQEADTFVPPHKHLGAAEFYVLKGCIEYRGGVAKAGHFGREPLGAVHERTSFPEETIYLFTSYGPLALYGADGAIAGITDAATIQALADA